MIYFKSKQTTEPSKLASAIAHNIKNSDIEIKCLGPQAVNAAIISHEKRNILKMNHLN